MKLKLKSKDGIEPRCKLIHGDCLEKLKDILADSIDSLVTDPPAGINFMGKHWDDYGSLDNFQQEMKTIFEQCFRVMKPGAHGLVWAIPRTSHHTAMALERCGFDVREKIYHLFGSGFPKSHNISKAIDKAAGVQNITAPATPEAKQWDGYGTALKPAVEEWILIRKPLEKGLTVAENVLKWGVGGINIDGCRIEAVDQQKLEKNWDRIQSERASNNNSGNMGLRPIDLSSRTPQGRFPANLILDEQAAKMLDEQSGPCKTGNIKPGTIQGFGTGNNCYGDGSIPREYKTDAATGASRFFYVAKTSTRERNEGLDEMDKVEMDIGDERPSGSSWERRGRAPSAPRANHHPTVKPIKLMSYLCRLVTPPSGTILDPFMGSGSAGIAALKEGFKFVGIEREQEYFDIAFARIEHARK